MSPGSTQLGFLTVIEQANAGLIGGYLVLNQMGRPIEFHCTTPVALNTAQEILYGNSLEPYVCGEQIAQNLLKRSKTPVSYVLTDTPAVLPVQDFVDQSVVYVFNAARKTADTESGENAEAPPKPAIEISDELNQSLLSFGISDSRFLTKSVEKQDVERVPAVMGLDTQRWQEAKIGNRTLAVLSGEGYNEHIEELTQFARTIDLAEPFSRIVRAVEEAQR